MPLRLALLWLVLMLVPHPVPAQDTLSSAPGDTVYLMPRIDVVGSRQDRRVLPGSASVLDRGSLEASRVFTTNEALRKLPGLSVREEEGLALRPNIGVRGLNPTRSTKTTLLEDGVPLSYAPYGDNASYYHPPIERFEEIELLKGADQTLFGPQTIGGVINYITPAPPENFAARVSGSAGSGDYAAGRVRVGGHRLLLDLTHKQADGARSNMDSRLDDLNLKAVVGRSLTLRAGSFRESSTITYSGLTQAEFERLGRDYNPFKNDAFEGRRYGGSATHRLVLGRSGVLMTNAYVSSFDRDWWRQSSTTTDTQGGPAVLATRLAGDPLDPDTIQSVQGRLREYTTWGIEPRARWDFAALGLSHELQAGLKAHFERQDRRQVNGTWPSAREGAVVEDNLRETEAYSAFLVHRARFGRWGVTPGLRYERIHSSRTNRLPGGPSGSDVLGQWIPSLGATWTASDRVVVYAGVHAGFAPPRTEDVIGSTGTATDVEAEESVNWEIGSRLEAPGRAELQVTLFRNDFRRLTAVGSVAGGSTPLAQGEARFSGIEVSGRAGHASGIYVRGAYTWLPDAVQTTPFRQVANGATVIGSAAGNRQPYAPEHVLTATAGWAWKGLDAQVEAVHTGSQFGDFANTVSPSADGQRGLLAASTLWNATLNQALAGPDIAAFVAVKNLADRTVIVDRTRGIQTGSPRRIQAGLSYSFGFGR